MDRRALLARGMAWTFAAQAAEALLTFGAMLILVRVIPAEEYGSFAALLGVMAVVNAFGAGGFIAQSLQLPDGEEPDWSLHLSAGLRIGLALALACNLLALALCFTVSYRPLVPLLRVASIGVVLETPQHILCQMLKRRMDFRRLRLLMAAATLVNIAVALALGLAGWGALAITIGLFAAFPSVFLIDLVFVERWRPAPGWWRTPDWARYREAIRFGLRQTGGALLGNGRDAAASAVLPRALGFFAMGLLNRAQGLFLMTVGRILNVLIETVYPLLPRWAADRERYPERASRFVQIVLWSLTPLVLLLGLCGWQVSRILYGPRWIAMDALLWPAMLAMLGRLFSQTASAVLLAANRLRASLLVDLAGALLVAPMVLWPLVGGDLVQYAWAVGGGALVAGMIALVAASDLCAPGFAAKIVAPLVIALAPATGAAIGLLRLLRGAPPIVQASVAGTAFLALVLATFRFVFAGAWRELVALLRGRKTAAGEEAGDAGGEPAR